jgi:predicted metal-dependent HD superfamily phosphohydrolase
VNYEKILEQVREYVPSFLKNHADARLIYHNVAHTRSVVAATIQIANHYQLNDEDFFAVCTAAWFHDTGYEAGADGHENRGVEIATEFLAPYKLKESVLDKIASCIKATKMPQNPGSILEQILCDADLFHLGTDEFTDGSKKLRKEMEALQGITIDKNEWRQRNIDMLQKHNFHTDYCRLLLNDKKQENLEKLLSKQHKEEKEQDTGVVEHPVVVPVADKPIALKKKARMNEKKSKGVETMFRVSSSNQQRLSYMADSKAHIMISVNSIIISLLLSLLLRNIDEHPNQVIPAIVLLVVNLVTIVFAILATRPNVTQGTFSTEDVQKRKVNLLFFGNFFKMDYDKYEEGMVDMMNDNDFLYGSLIRDIYSQGVVLGRKYRLLRISYNVFMYGLIISVIAFVVSTIGT